MLFFSFYFRFAPGSPFSFTDYVKGPGSWFLYEYAYWLQEQDKEI